MVVFKSCLVWGLLRVALIRAVQFESVASIEPTLVVTNESIDSTFLFSNETLPGLIYEPWDLPEHIFDEDSPSTTSSENSFIVTTDSNNWEATDQEYEELVRWHSNSWLRSAVALTVTLGGSGGDDDEEDEESRRKRRRIRHLRGLGLRALIRLFFSRYGDNLDTEYESNETTDHPLLVQHISNLQNLRHLERKLRDTESEICAQRQVLGLSQNYQGSIKLRLRLARQQRRVVNARKKVLKSMRRCWDEGVLDESDSLTEDAPRLPEIYLDECERVSDRKGRDRQTPSTIYEDRESIYRGGEEHLSNPPQPISIKEDGEWSVHATLALAAVPYDGDLQPTGEINPWRAYDEALPSSFMGFSETPSDENFPFPDLEFAFHEDENNLLSSGTPKTPQGRDELDFEPPLDVILWPVTPNPGITDRSGSELQPNKIANSFGQYSEPPYPSPDLISSEKSPMSNSVTIDLKDTDQPSPNWIAQGTGDHDYSPPINTYLPSPSTEQAASTDEGKSYSCSHCSRRYSRPSELKKHLKSLSKSFTCPIPNCNMAFGIKKDLERHLRGPHGNGEKRHACHHDQCGKRYIRKDALQKHLRQKHDKQENIEIKQQYNESEKSFDRGLRHPSNLVRSTIQQIGQLKRKRGQDIHHSSAPREPVEFRLGEVRISS